MGLATLWTALATDFLEVASGVTPTPDQELVFLAAFVAIFAITMGYASVGALLAGRGTGGRIGALLLGGGFLFALIPFGYVVGGSLVIADPSSALFSALQVLGPVAVGPGYMMILPGVAIAFPDGRVPSPRWRLPIGIVVCVVGVGTLLQLVRPGPLLVGGPASGARNPFGIEALAAFGGVADVAVSLGLFAITILGVAAVIVRYRRGDPTERQQQRWFLAAVSLAAVPFALTVLPWTGGPQMALIAAVGLILVPVSVGIAVTRYRLYEIDHLISRTLVYVPLTALLAGLYAAVVSLLQRVFQSVTGDRSDAAIIISTLVLASVFTPLRKWLEGIVDRRFKPAPSADSVASGGPGSDSSVGPEWDDRMAAVALRVVRTELEARALKELPVRGDG
jgi:hypothetical protein